MILTVRELALAVCSSMPAAILTKATVVAAIGLVGARLARRQRAAVRHVILAATFGVLLLLPVASIVVPPVRIAVPAERQDRATVPPTAGAIDWVPPRTLPDKHSAVTPTMPRSSRPSTAALLLLGWLAGMAFALIPLLVGLWKIRWLRRSALSWSDGQAAVDVLALETGIRRHVDLLLHEALPGPITIGILEPAILLPPDAETWQKDDLNRALVHELEHVRRGDVVVHCLGRAVGAVYGFHPLVWLAWRQLTLEAERACDDAVIARSEATAYADQLVALARKLLATARSPVLAMANRSDLAVRVGAVLDDRQRRGRAGRFAVALGCAVSAVLTLTISPLMTVSVPQSRSVPTAIQSSPRIGTGGPLPSFEVASVKPTRSGSSRRIWTIMPERFATKNVTTKMLIAYAYSVRDSQILGGPNWIDSEEFDIIAKNEDAVTEKLRTAPWEQYRELNRLMVQSLLADRFQLKVTHETKDLPVYALVIAKNGPKLTLTKGPPPGPGPKRGPWISTGSGQLTTMGMSLGELAETLADFPDLGKRKVLDQTGLTGRYDIAFKWTPDQGAAGMVQGPGGGKSDTDDAPAPGLSGPSIFTAIQEQLGLKLESTKGPMDVIVIDHLERPSAN